jgi:hypothetical protein
MYPNARIFLHAKYILGFSGHLYFLGYTGKYCASILRQRVPAAFDKSVSQIIIWSAMLAFSVENPRHAPIRIRLFLGAFASYVLVGAVLWVWEMNYCASLLPYFISSPFGGMTFHVLWHIGSVAGAYLLNIFLAVIRSP